MSRFRPRPRLHLTAAVAVLALVAGCIETNVPVPETQVDPSQTAAGLWLPWALADCAFTVAFVPADAERVAAELPEGFVLESEGLGIEVFRCGSGTGLQGNVTDMVYGSYFTAVTPPEHLAIAGVDEYYYKWWVLVPDTERRALFTTLGMPAYAGTGAVDEAPTALGPLHDAELTVEGIGPHTFRSASPQREDGGGGGEDDRFAEFTPLASGGHAVWQARYTTQWSASGNGVVELPEGGWAASIVGAPTAAAFISTGAWSFHDGNVTLPATNARTGEADPSVHDHGHSR